MANGNGKEKEGWLERYLDYTSEQESPQLFHLWVGISVLASALGRKVWIDRGHYTLFPNLYVVLVGASARVRKTTALNIGFHLFKEAFPAHCTIAQKITPEALIGVLRDEAKEKGSAEGVMVSSELSVFLGSSIRDDSLIQLLTKLYDCESTMDYHTIIRGKEVLPNVCFNMLGATTPEWIKTSMPSHAVGGGFTSRIIFVYQFEGERRIPFPTVSSRQAQLKAALIKDLQHIGSIKGGVVLTAEAKEWYSDWYCDVYNPDGKESGLEGYYGRKADTLLKLAVVFTVSRTGKIVVDEQDLVKALNAMNENEKYLPEIMRNIQSNLIGEERGKVLRVISRRSEISYGDLLRAVSYCIDSAKLNMVINGLVEEGAIEESIDGKGKRHFKVSK